MEVEIESDDDEEEDLPSHIQCIEWISKIQKAAPKLGVPEDSMIHLRKFVVALSRAKLGKAKKPSSLHDFCQPKPKKGGNPNPNPEKGGEAPDQRNL